ncbi:MAG: LD-carboxypeptidase [Bacteroidetes bacterium]|jgi:muramoyltetrapeptide carboxypeptidase|nr:LD-carboxypeptidase [Bacteroidota bacterium]
MIAVRHPRPVHRGDTIAVIAPSSPPRDAEVVEQGIARLQAAGFSIVRSRDAWDHPGYLAGTDDERLEELNAMLRRDDVRAILCARGGYGALRLLPHIDYEAARRHRPLLIGFSDITALHLALFARAGLPGISGALVAEWTTMDAASVALLWQLAGGATPAPLLGPHDETLSPMRTGTAEGVLLGGNLSVLTRLIGTPYLPSLDGALLFLEDVDERPYSLDRMLAHLRLAGHLDHLAGVVLGRFTDWTGDDDPSPPTPEDVFRDYFQDAPYPVATGLPYGHMPDKAPIPVGVQARLDVKAGGARLDILEPIVRAASS